VRINEGGIQEALELSKQGATPEICDSTFLIDGCCSTHKHEVQGDSLSLVIIPIHDHGTKVAILRSTNDMDVLSAVENTGGLFTEEVLIDSDEILVLQDSKGVFGDCVKVATNDERSLSECP